MPVSIFDLLIIIVYFLIIMCIGYNSTKKVKSFADYAVAGRSIPVVFLFATMAATAIGGGSTIGRVAFAYYSGVVIFMATIGFAANQIFTGLFIAPRMRAMGNVYTVGDIMGYYYGRAGQFLTGAFTLLYSISVYGVQILVMGKILQIVTGLPLIPLVIIASMVVVAYTWAGGMWAVIHTDILQFIILAFGITTAALIILNEVGGVSGLRANLSIDHLSIFGGWGLRKFAAFSLIFFFSEAVAPFYVQRYLSSRSPRDSRWGVTIFGVYYGFFTIMIVVIGLSGAILLPNIAPDLVISSLIHDYLPIGLVGLAFVALIAAIMSTTDSVLNTSAIIFTRDIYKKFINPAANDITMLRWSKSMTIIIGIGGVIVALCLPRIFDLLIFTYSLWAPSILPPLCISLLWGKSLKRKVSSYAGPPAIIAGLITTFIWGSKVLGEPFMLPAPAAGIAANLVVFIIIHAITFKKNPTSIFTPEEIEAEV